MARQTRAIIKRAFPLKSHKCNLLATHSKNSPQYYVKIEADTSKMKALFWPKYYVVGALS